MTVLVWFFIGLIFFQYVPTLVFSQPIENVWTGIVEKPWFGLHYYVRLAIGWLALLGLVFGSALYELPYPVCSSMCADLNAL